MFLQSMPYPRTTGIYNGAFVTVTVPAGQVTADVANFPVCIDLSDMPSGFWSAVDAAGAEIRVTNADGSAALPTDVVHIDSGTDTGHLFFKADLASASANVFRIYYETGLSAPAETDPEGRNLVWSRFNRAYDGRSNVDRTGNGAAFTLVGNATFTSGQIVFDGANDFAYVPCGAPGDFTLFVIGLLQTGGPATHKIIANYATAGTGTPGFRESLTIRDTGNWALWHPSVWVESAVAAVFDADFTAAIYYDVGVKRAIWVNGSEAASGGSAGAPTTTNPHLTLGGEDDTPGQESKCQLDLVLYALEALPAAYLAGLHNNRRNRGSFYAIS